MPNDLKEIIKPKLATFCIKCGTEMELEIVENDKADFRLKMIDLFGFFVLL